MMHLGWGKGIKLKKFKELREHVVPARAATVQYGRNTRFSDGSSFNIW